MLTPCKVPRRILYAWRRPNRDGNRGRAPRSSGCFWRSGQGDRCHNFPLVLRLQRRVRPDPVDCLPEQTYGFFRLMIYFSDCGHGLCPLPPKGRKSGRAGSFLISARAGISEQNLVFSNSRRYVGSRLGGKALRPHCRLGHEAVIPSVAAAFAPPTETESGRGLATRPGQCDSAPRGEFLRRDNALRTSQELYHVLLIRAAVRRRTAKTSTRRLFFVILSPTRNQGVGEVLNFGCHERNRAPPHGQSDHRGAPLRGARMMAPR